MQFGFTNDTNRPTGVNLYSLSGSTWEHRWGGSVASTYSYINMVLSNESSNTWKIDFIG
jgi:hypothetical protein